LESKKPGESPYLTAEHAEGAEIELDQLLAEINAAN